MSLGAVALASALVLIGCTGSGTSGGGKVSPSDIDKALSTPTTLTFWTWVPNIKNKVALFEKKYPKIKVNVVNVGSGAGGTPSSAPRSRPGRAPPTWRADRVPVHLLVPPEQQSRGSLEVRG